MNRSGLARLLTAGLALSTIWALQPAARLDAQTPLDAVVQFGPAHPQPATPGNHRLVPDEVTILKGGTVTFQVNGDGHGIAIYPVHHTTTRADIQADLSPGGPGAPLCMGATADPRFLITDGKGDLIIDTGFAVAGVPFFDYPLERVIAAIGGSAVFLNGSTAAPVPPATVPAPGVALQHRFAKTGRYLVICINRFHAINDYMFGFVNVVGED